MNDDELAAYSGIAEALTLYAYSMAEREYPILGKSLPDSNEPIYFHHHESALESTADNLCRLKILKGVHLPSDPARSPYLFSFNYSTAEARTVALANWKIGPPLNELIENLIHLLGGHGNHPWGFSTERSEPFGKGSRLEPVLKALKKIGYLDEVAEGFVWTKEIELFMFRYGYWRAIR